jgi:uncharacterized membrane protein
MSNSPHNPFHNELKKEFQLERMILFSDAVFAIAITLLAIEIKVPEVAKEVVTDHLLVEKLNELLPKFIGFLVSFFVISVYWVAHHRMFGFVVNYNHRLLWLNLLFLLAVVLMPFSSAFYSEYIVRRLKMPMIVYVCNIVFLATMSLVIWEYIASPKRGLSEGITPHIQKYFRFRALVPCIAFLLLGSMYVFVDPAIAIWLPLFIPIVMRLLRRFYLKPQLNKS